MKLAQGLALLKASIILEVIVIKKGAITIFLRVSHPSWSRTSIKTRLASNSHHVPQPLNVMIKDMCYHTLPHPVGSKLLPAK